MSAFARISALQAQPTNAAQNRCNTCQFDAESKEEIREHYKGDWHVHNSRRRAAQQPPVSRAEFKAKARKVRAQQQAAADAKPSNSSHLTDEPRNETPEQSVSVAQPASLLEQTEQPSTHPEQDDAAEEEELQDIDELTSIFDSRKFSTIEDNLEYCHRRYGLFIPDREYIIDLPGLVRYLNEKVKHYCTCLYCQREFSSARACQRHMIDKSHCKILYDDSIDAHEYDEYYDFSSSYSTLLSLSLAQQQQQGEDKGGEEDGEDGLEDLGLKFEVSEIGELVLLDGRSIGHRELRRYYRQNVRVPDTRVAVVELKKDILAKLACTSQVTSEELQRMSMQEVLSVARSRHSAEVKARKREEMEKARNEQRVAGKFAQATIDPASQAMKRRTYGR